jgi:hypothetical protein
VLGPRGVFRKAEETAAATCQDGFAGKFPFKLGLNYHGTGKLQMRLCRHLFALALILPSWPVVAVAGEKQQDYDIDLIVTMSGRCSTLTIAGRDLACRAVKYFHSRGGRGYFTIAIDDASDYSHIVSFSGDDARREGDSVFELKLDQMLLNSRDRPQVEGLRVPLVEASSGTCRQVGTMLSGKISKISCAATDKSGRKYELQFDSDGRPAMVQRISQAPLLAEQRRARLKAVFECRRKAVEANILPRDSAAHIIQCLEEGRPPADEQQ